MASPRLGETQADALTCRAPQACDREGSSLRMGSAGSRDMRIPEAPFTNCGRCGAAPWTQSIGLSAGFAGVAAKPAGTRARLSGGSWGEEAVVLCHHIRSRVAAHRAPDTFADLVMNCQHRLHRLVDLHPWATDRG